MFARTYTRIHAYSASDYTIRDKEKEYQNRESANTAFGSGNRYNIQRGNAWPRAYGATPLPVHCYMKVHRPIAHSLCDLSVATAC